VLYAVQRAHTISSHLKRKIFWKITDVANAAEGNRQPQKYLEIRLESTGE
jgi:hypothetical protein